MVPIEKPASNHLYDSLAVLHNTQHVNCFWIVVWYRWWLGFMRLSLGGTLSPCANSVVRGHALNKVNRTHGHMLTEPYKYGTQQDKLWWKIMIAKQTDVCVVTASAQGHSSLLNKSFSWSTSCQNCLKTGVPNIWTYETIIIGRNNFLH